MISLIVRWVSLARALTLYTGGSAARVPRMPSTRGWYLRNPNDYMRTSTRLTNMRGFIAFS